MMKQSEPDQKAPSKRNAFSELMAPKPKHSKTTLPPPPPPEEYDPPPSSAENIPTSRRHGLNIYINSPATFPASIVISHNPSFVTIHDLYPKSTIHLLVLPRSPQKTHLHPFTALDISDPTFLSSLRDECAKARTLAASELRRRFGRFSAQDRAREEAMAADPPPDELPPGRDWEKEIMVGVHAVPSMANLHIHVISRDRYSDCLKHRKHYNSFATPFFVPLDDFPLEEDDRRRWPGEEGYLKADFRCWRCGREFGSGFKRLKEHLEVEFEEWKRE